MSPFTPLSRRTFLKLSGILASTIAAVDTSNVNTAFVAGDMVKHNGQLIGVDVAK